MKVSTVLLVIIALLVGSHFHYYKEYVMDKMDWKTTLDINGSNISFARNHESGFIESTVLKHDPHHFARAIGYAHAKDRLAQMNQQRWAGHGKLSECLASTDELKQVDVFLRGLRFTKTAEEILSRISEEDLAYFQAYADGVNYFLETRKESLTSMRYFHYFTGGWLRALIPVESTLIDSCGLQEWKPIDSVVIVNLMGYLGLAEVQAETEKFFLQALHAGIPNSALQEIFPHFSELSDDMIEIYKSINLSSTIVPKDIPFLSSFPKFIASNNWVVAPKKSASGNAIQCNDPHLDTSRLPAIWYQYLHRSVEDGRFWFGITVPGFPAVIMGRTREVSYGLTYGFMDQLDFFVEEVKDGKYREGNEYFAFQRRYETITSKDGSIINLLFLESQDGIRSLELQSHLLSDLVASDGSLRISNGRYLSRAFSASLITSENFPVFYPMEATNVKEAQQILRQSCVSANYLIADLEGNIGYQQSGMLPARKSHGLFPVLAWEEGATWRGAVHPSLLNSLYNPEEGFIMTANDDWQAEGDYPTTINLHMGPYRSLRGKELLSGKEKLSVDDMMLMQADNYSKQAEAYFQHLKPLLSDPSIDRKIAKILDEWNFEYDVNSEAPLFFSQFLREVFKDVFGRLFGREVVSYLFLHRISILTVYMGIFDEVILNSPNERLWFGEEGRTKTFIKALSTLKYTPSRYGDYHQIVMYNIYFKESLSFLLGYSKPAVPVGGGDQTLNAGAHFTPPGYHESWFCPSWRYISDMGENFVLTSLPGGVSARRFSGLYDNNLEKYFSFQYDRINLL